MATNARSGIVREPGDLDWVCPCGSTNPRSIDCGSLCGPHLFWQASNRDALLATFVSRINGESEPEYIGRFPVAPV